MLGDIVFTDQALTFMASLPPWQRDHLNKLVAHLVCEPEVGEVVRNPTFKISEFGGQPRRIRVFQIEPQRGGVRMIYYIARRYDTLVVYKIAFRDSDPYEDGR